MPKPRRRHSGSAAARPQGQPGITAQLAGQIGEIARRLVDLERRMRAVDGKERLGAPAREATGDE